MAKTCKIYWDDLSYQLNNSDNSFSIVNIQGAPYSINWDNQQHIINNPNNFSYEIIKEIICQPYYPRVAVKSVFLSGGCYPRGVTSINNVDIWQYTGYQKLEIINYQWEFQNILCGAYSQNGINYPEISNFRLRVFFKYYNSNCTSFQNQNILLQGGGTSGNGMVQSFNRQVPVFVSIRSVPMQYYSEPANKYQIRIFDNVQYYYYPITNTNSISIINSDPSIKIEIEGHQFDIIDVNSARKDCTEQCPPDTITCDCGNERCCYKQVEYGYQLVKSINL